jgi:hypothetical protein
MSFRPQLWAPIRLSGYCLHHALAAQNYIDIFHIDWFCLWFIDELAVKVCGDRVAGLRAPIFDRLKRG